MNLTSRANAVGGSEEILISPRAHFPAKFADIQEWSARFHLSEDDALERFTHFAVLKVLASAPQFRERLVLRGAGALYLFYGNQRPTSDLDLIDLRMSVFPSAAESLQIESHIGKCLYQNLPSMFPESKKCRAYLLEKVQIHVSRPRGLLRFHTTTLDSSSWGLRIGVADIHFLVSEKIAGILSWHWPRAKARRQDVADIATAIALFGTKLQSSLVQEYFRSRCALEPRLTTMGFNKSLRDAHTYSCDDMRDNRFGESISFERGCCHVFSKPNGDSGIA